MQQHAWLELLIHQMLQLRLISFYKLAVARPDLKHQLQPFADYIKQSGLIIHTAQLPALIREVIAAVL